MLQKFIGCPSSYISHTDIYLLVTPAKASSPPVLIGIHMESSV